MHCTLVQVDNIMVEHPDAAGRNCLAQLLRGCAAVDTIQRVLAVLKQL